MDLLNLGHIGIPVEEEQDYTFGVKDGSFKARLANIPKSNLVEINDCMLSALVKADPCGDDPKIQTALYLQEKRAELSEVERERRKAQVDIVEIDDAGNVTVRTSNTRKMYKERKLCNFSNPTLKILSNGKSKMYCISFVIKKTSKEIFILESDAGNGKLLLQKFNAVGADFLMDKVGKKINAALQLLALLLKNASEEIILPPEPGWYNDAFGKIKFCTLEGLSWKTLMISF